MYEQKFKDKSKKVKIIYEIKQKHTKLSVSGENIYRIIIEFYLGDVG